TAAPVAPQERRTPASTRERLPPDRARRAPCHQPPLRISSMQLGAYCTQHAVFMQPYAYGGARKTTMALREVILTVLARGEMTDYEITKDFEAVYVHFWRASHQQVYRELARLHKDGQVTVKVVAQE